MRGAEPPRATPRATGRLQFHAGFTLKDAAGIVPYLASLGISHLYASPLFRARRGSPHGYDVVDYGAINPELGGLPALEHLGAVLRRHGMGLVLDIVPNHMAADARENEWWRDVLTCGRASRYAGFFDIDWSSAELCGKVLLPVLGRPCEEALAAGEIRIEGEAREVAYFEHRFPLAPGTLSAGSLPAVLEAQHYRLAWWRTAGDAINWRRFFDINGLVALRAERAEVFAATHGLVRELFAAGLIDGVRVDHLDGIADPGRYCRRLRSALAGPKRAYIVVEKILARGETLPEQWDVDGTTGYDFMADAAGVLHDPAGEAPLSRLWARVTGSAEDFAAVERRARAEILARVFAAEATRAVRALGPARDLPRAALGRAVAAVARNFPAYRAYPDGEKGMLERALAAASRDLARADLHWLERLGAMLIQPGLGRARVGQIRFQLLTAPLAAKAVEDTGFYRYGRLLSHNEVGASPSHFALTAGDFHASVLARQRHFPNAMLATATHDHKRGEDVRARLAVLSEIPAEWAALVESWMRRNAARRRMLAGGPAPGPADELMLYQTLVGAWPALLDAADDTGVAAFADRVARWQEKALREAKERTDWAAPDEEYETACREFLIGMLADPALRQEVAAFAARIGPAGAVNGLAQTMLRLAVPGVPDLYQGTEFWDESLVDPDNRRPVDFVARHAALSQGVSLCALLRSWRTGHVKQALVGRMLALRARLPRLFAAGLYCPLEIAGPRAGHALAFLRVDGTAHLLIAVARHAVKLLGTTSAPILDPHVWEGTVLYGTGPAPWQNALVPAPPLDGAERLPLKAIFGSFPFACWKTGYESRPYVHGRAGGSSLRYVTSEGCAGRASVGPHT